MWCFAPALATRVKEQQMHNHSLRSVAIQAEIYKIPLYELKLALAVEWHLTELLTILMDADNAEQPRVRNVKLAVDLARHSANGWDDAALPDDYKAIGELLRLNEQTVLKRIGVPEPETAAETPAADASRSSAGLRSQAAVPAAGSRRRPAQPAPPARSEPHLAIAPCGMGGDHSPSHAGTILCQGKKSWDWVYPVSRYSADVLPKRVETGKQYKTVRTNQATQPVPARRRTSDT